jgi:hypothetical protein
MSLNADGVGEDAAFHGRVQPGCPAEHRNARGEYRLRAFRKGTLEDP